MPPRQEPQAAPNGPAPTLRDRVAAVRHLPALLRLVWRTHRGYTAAVVGLRFARALVPFAMLWIGKLIVDEVVRSTPGAGDLDALWRFLALEIMLVVLADLLGRASAVMESLLGDLFSNDLSVRIIEHAATLDLEQFEDPAFYDRLERTRQETPGRIKLLNEVLSIGQDAVTLAALGAALLAYSPALGLLLLLSVIPSFLGETHFAGLGYSLLYRFTPERRQLGYIRVLGAGNRTAKEVQMFGLAGWLTGRYRALADRFYAENRRLVIRKSGAGFLLALLGTAGYYMAYVVILRAAAAGSISLGQLIFLAGSFARSRDLVQGLLRAAAGIYEQCLYLKDLFVFFATQPRIVSAPGARPVPTPIETGFVFEDVGFRYPGSERWAVRHLDFRLHPGECLALVGENGAGKTTVTKLLARLYDPTEGRITLDGIDLREYDLAALRGAMGVIFQDFVRFEMRFEENIGVGKIEELREYLDRTGPAQSAGGRRNGHPKGPGVPPMIATAAEQSLAASILPRLPLGYQQMLGRLFEGGVELSGGEWQKVALARAYARDSAIRILDEPTAALDARAEYDIFERFRELTRGRMAVIISHRFSTVRMADRILVLQEGRLIEAGTHYDLLELGGQYAELFGMQAAGYR
jgi:ATP-binding cassette, subfamily B, bacterial